MNNKMNGPEARGKEGGYDVVLCDPPWPAQSGEKHYRTMSVAAIAAMGPAVQSVLAENAWIFMWTTKALLSEAEQVMAAWGGQVQDFIVWGKVNRIGFGNKRYGIRRATEYLLVGTRGEVTAEQRITADWFPAGVSLRHSAKPHHQYAIVDELAGMNVRRLELFARHRQPGWDVWGDDPAVQPTDVSFAAFGYPVPSDSEEATAGTLEGRDA